MIGNVEIKGYAALAPMAGVADKAMREICCEFGAAYSVAELTSAKGVSLGDIKSQSLLDCEADSYIAVPQLFGNEPEIMASAAKKAMQFSPRFIDINMGCPAPKVAGNGGGSALMCDVLLAERIVRAVVDAVDVPVTVKMRAGWDSEKLNAVELARACEQAGAAAVTVHGRTKKQMYAPPVDLEIIRRVKSSVMIPVIGNGDISDGASAKQMYDYTGCDLVMVGRAAMGNPFIFSEINAYFEDSTYSSPSLDERFDACMHQIKLMCKYKAPRIAMLEARKHTAWYMTGLNGAASLRRMCGEISSLSDIELVFEKCRVYNSL